MTTLQIVFFAAAGVTVAEAVYLIARGVDRPDMRAAGLYFLSVALFNIGNGLATGLDDWLRGAGLVVVAASTPLIPFFWLLFTSIWGRDISNDPYYRTNKPWLVLAGIFGVALLVTNLLVPGIEVVAESDRIIHFRLGGYSFPLLLYFLTCFLFGLHNLECSFRSSLGRQRQQLRGGMLLLSILTGLAFFAATLGLLAHELDIWTLVLIAVIVPVVFIPVARHLIGLDPGRYGVMVTRRVASSSAAILLGGLYFIAVGALSKLFSSEMIALEQVDTALAALLTMTILLAVFAVNRIGLPARGAGADAAGGEQIRTFLNDMAVAQSVEGLLDHLRLFLRYTFGVSRGDLIERRQDGEWRIVALGERTARRPTGDVGTLADWLHRFGGPIRFDDLREHLHATDMTVDWLETDVTYYPGLLGAIAGRQTLVGILVLDTTDLRDDQGDNLARFLETVSGPLALAIQNSHFTEQLIQSRAQESFQKMSSFVMHDLKNSVGMLDLLLSNARTNLDNPEFQQSMLGTIKDAVRRQRRIIARLSEPEAATPVELTEIDPVDLVRQVIEKTQVRNIEHVELTEDYAAVPPIRTDPVRLASVLENLVSNALEAMPAGGRLDISVRPADTTEQDGITIRVADTGCGMTEEFINEELFRQFASTKKKGMGIGMFQSREAIHQLGGTIEVESEPGRGTTFTVTLRT